MISIDYINNSNVGNTEVETFALTLRERLLSIDFSSFNIDRFNLHFVINADNESVKLSSSLPKENRYIFYQGIPTAYAYNSEFEAKLATIRLRIQNINIEFEAQINNIIFVIDFTTVSNSTLQDDNKTQKAIRNIFKYKDSNTDEDKRKMTFVPVTPKYSLDKVVMSSDMKEQIQDTLSIIQNRKRIYEEWGFNEVDPQPKAILSFWGAPGTGKTMCAHAIANSLHKKILPVNYAEIESKYAGESPKNLIAAFNTAQELNAVLFFDEADSFLGKRITNVESGHDQSINSLRSQMLILLEEFEGIVIFATNLVKNFDSAFQTRILRHIHFDLPDEQGRATIYKTLMPSKVPVARELKDEDFLLFAQASINFSGRDIRNTILDTLSNAARLNLETINNENFLDCINKRVQSYDKLQKSKTQENKKIEEDIKNSIIEKSKHDFNEALMGLALHAAWADNELDNHEEKLINELATALNVELSKDMKQEYLPPLSQLTDFLISKEQKLKALDLVIRIIAIDGKFSEDEKNFLEDLMTRLWIKEDTKHDLFEYAKSLAKLNKYWESIVI